MRSKVLATEYSSFSVWMLVLQNSKDKNVYIDMIVLDGCGDRPSTTVNCITIGHNTIFGIIDFW